MIFDHPGGKEIAADIAGAKDYRVLHPRTKQEVVPALLDGKQVPYTQDNFPRLELAKWMTSHPYLRRGHRQPDLELFLWPGHR